MECAVGLASSGLLLLLSALLLGAATAAGRGDMCYRAPPLRMRIEYSPEGGAVRSTKEARGEVIPVRAVVVLEGEGEEALQAARHRAAAVLRSVQLCLVVDGPGVEGERGGAHPAPRSGRPATTARCALTQASGRAPHACARRGF